MRVTRHRRQIFLFLLRKSPSATAYSPIKLSRGAELGRNPRRALNCSSPAAFHTQRCAALCKSSKRIWAGSLSSELSSKSETVLRITVNSLFKSLAAAPATA